jgi:hypothetical protein
LILAHDILLVVTPPVCRKRRRADLTQVNQLMVYGWQGTTR